MTAVLRQASDHTDDTYQAAAKGLDDDAKDVNNIAGDDVEHGDFKEYDADVYVLKRDDSVKNAVQYDDAVEITGSRKKRSVDASQIEATKELLNSILSDLQ